MFDVFTGQATGFRVYVIGTICGELEKPNRYSGPNRPFGLFFSLGRDLVPMNI